jgi:hypothetical protein
MTIEPRYRRPLNDYQLDILNLLYRFRFTTTELLALSLDVKYKHKMNLRLKVLLDQGYIGRNYKPSYHLGGRHASFYLAAEGIKALKELPGSNYTPSVLKNLYKDKTASERFINHWLGVFNLYCSMKANYGDQLRFFSRSEIAGFEYFPKKRPDGYIRLTSGTTERHYILEILDSSQPFFVQVNMIKKYIAYADEGDWEDATGSELPIVILVCGSLAQQRKLQKFADNEIDDFDPDDDAIVITTPKDLNNIIDAEK